MPVQRLSRPEIIFLRIEVQALNLMNLRNFEFLRNSQIINKLHKQILRLRATGQPLPVSSKKSRNNEFGEKNWVARNGAFHRVLLSEDYKSSDNRPNGS